MLEREEKFTPGPWHVKPREKWEGRYGVSYSRTTILTDPEMQYSPRHVIATVARGNGREEANAALIAAAPELYKCLQSILANCIIKDHYRGPAEVLLAKARGEEAENA